MNYMPDVYRDNDALLKDYDKLTQEYKNKAGRYIKNLLKLQRAESGLRGKISMVEFEQRQAAREQGAEDEIRCSFCGKPQPEANHIIAGSGVYICDDCARLCVEVLDDLETKQQQSTSSNREEGTGT